MDLTVLELLELFRTWGTIWPDVFQNFGPGLGRYFWMLRERIDGECKQRSSLGLLSGTLHPAEQWPTHGVPGRNQNGN